MATEPLILLNGTLADANEVMALFNEIYSNIDQTNVAAANKTGTGKFVLQTSPTIDSPLFIGSLTVDSPTFHVDATNNRVGVGTITPGYLFDVRSTSGASQIHVSRNSGDNGGWITSATNDSDITLSGGAAYNGANWVAKATSAAFIDIINGGFGFFADSALVVGNTYSPTRRVSISTFGDLSLNSTAKLYLDGGSDTYIYEVSANQTRFVNGGIPVFDVTPSAISIPPTFRFYLDGASNTSIRESAADTITFEAGGSDRLNITSALSIDINTSTSTSGRLVNIICTTTTGNAGALLANRASSVASPTRAMEVGSSNANGAGTAIGIDLSSINAANGRIFSVPTDNTDPTGGGGAAIGRIAIDVGGTLRYLAYY